MLGYWLFFLIDLVKPRFRFSLYCLFVVDKIIYWRGLVHEWGTSIKRNNLNLALLSFEIAKFYGNLFIGSGFRILINPNKKIQPNTKHYYAK